MDVPVVPTNTSTHASELTCCISRCWLAVVECQCGMRVRKLCPAVLPINHNQKPRRVPRLSSSSSLIHRPQTHSSQLCHKKDRPHRSKCASSKARCKLPGYLTVPGSTAMYCFNHCPVVQEPSAPPPPLPMPGSDFDEVRGRQQPLDNTGLNSVWMALQELRSGRRLSAGTIAGLPESARRHLAGT
ncbi:hypothetical protein PENSPDRAFT_650820 [Peniophora sp. CONT]|nr:hypothetical protein PENSPDRAFT_650820 [Peniophora sp. CONT]